MRSCAPRPKDLWSGVNSYFIHTLPESDQESLLSSLHAAGVSKIRIFITKFGKGGKNTTSVGANDLEEQTVGVYNDTILNQIDQLMYRMEKYNMKLLIAMHDYWVLVDEYFICDAYCQKYCKNPAVFYNTTQAAHDIDNRYKHIINHRNPYLKNRKYKDLDNVIYAVELQNEAQGEGIVNPYWWCDRATELRKHMRDSGVLISTGGGRTFVMSNSTINFNCKALDVIAIHSYDTNIQEVITNFNNAKYLKRAKQVVVFEEFGIQAGSGSLQAKWLDAVGQVSNTLNVNWMPWEVSSVSLPNDYEFNDSDTATWAALVKNNPHP
ncbi:hypothetical protein HK100_004198 [Physocladia obscura]|uniref:mannan endo-1,4-beta-mannosidase n=1 Tax=Physocladia obscura TaxID=109957 RepID=A0AAD5XD50_9FUNG|nr:hypothetical protein HK100_004198 [Physocladia obscura]